MSAEAPRILVVEDEAALAESVRYNLEREGFTVTVAGDGRRAIERFRTDQPALVILDLMLPEMSGLDVCRLIRQESDVPIIMVTAKDAEADKVTGLELGADDYVTKPFSVRELVSRVRAHLRRAAMGTALPPDEILKGGPVEMDVARHQVLVSDELVAVPAEGVRAAGELPAAQGPAADPPLPHRGGLGERLRGRHEDPGRPREADPPEDREGPPRPRAPADGARAGLQVRGLRSGVRRYGAPVDRPPCGALRARREAPYDGRSS